MSLTKIAVVDVERSAGRVLVKRMEAVFRGVGASEGVPIGVVTGFEGTGVILSGVRMGELVLSLMVIGTVVIGDGFVVVTSMTVVESLSDEAVAVGEGVWFASDFGETTVLIGDAGVRWPDSPPVVFVGELALARVGFTLTWVDIVGVVVALAIGGTRSEEQPATRTKRTRALIRIAAEHTDRALTIAIQPA